MLVAIGTRVLRKGLMHSKIFKDFRIKSLRLIMCLLWACLGFAYFAETENFLLKVL